MPHFKDGRVVHLFDRVKAITSHRYEKDKPPVPSYSEALVIGICPGAESCELTVLVGSAKFIGAASIMGDEKGAPRGGVLLDGYWTCVTASETELLPKGVGY